MVISRTPFRISFFGGGTDYPVWYEENGGAVLSTSINKYCYITCRYLPPFFDYNYRIVYSKTELCQSVSEIQHPSAREVLAFFNLDRPINMQYDADLPARTGIGSSSSFTVGLLNALYALQGKMVTKRQLALDAIHIEQDRIKENVGSQDQTIAAFGGFNRIEFSGSRKITVRFITIDTEKLNLFQDHLMLFFTGFSREASKIAGEQIRRTQERKKELKAMMEMVDEGISILCSPSGRLDDFGKLLHESWKIKRRLTSLITTPFIDEVYDTAIKAGAIGGKLLGAGGGGCILFFVNPEYHKKIKDKLSSLLYVPFKLESQGSQIIFYSPSAFYHE